MIPFQQEGCATRAGMMQPARPDDEEVHAYIDDRLDPARRLGVALYLATHPGEAARSEAFRAQKEAIRALFDHVLEQPVPERLLATAQRRGGHAPWLNRLTWWRCSWAMAVLGIVFGLTFGARAMKEGLRPIAAVLLATPVHDGHRPSGPGLEILHPPLPDRQPGSSIGI